MPGKSSLIRTFVVPWLSSLMFLKQREDQVLAQLKLSNLIELFIGKRLIFMNAFSNGEINVLSGVRLSKKKLFPSSGNFLQTE